VKGQNKTTC